MKILQLFCIILLSLNLSGCFDAIYTGADTFYHNYGVEKSINNNWAELKVINALNADKAITQNGSIAVTSVNFVVLLTGQVRNEATRELAVKLASRVKGVKRVVNAIRVGPPISTGQSIKDSWITTKIKTKMLFDEKIDASAIKVVTDGRGNVFLLGVVPEPMAKLAVKLARHTDGVQKVIRLFEIETVKAI